VLTAVFVTYVATVTVYLALQALFARRGRTAPPPPARLPSVDVVIPCYNEKPETLAACLAAIAAQDYPGDLAVHVVDDGSPNRADLEPVYARHEGAFRVVRLPDNRGKRYAQAEAVTSSDGEIVVSVDSDTMLAPDAIRHIVAALDDEAVGAVMGEMLVANASQNWLTRLIDQRYWYACNQVSAAESAFGAVLCCCGPFSAYRRTVLEKVLDDYLNQTFLGRHATQGEDRHLTNLVLRAGMRTGYAPDARALTVAPDRMRPFLRQQLRWNRCTYRDTLGIARHLPSFGPYLVFDATVQIVAPLLLGLTLVLLAVHVVVHGPADLTWYGGGLALVGLAYSGYGWRQHGLRSLRLAAYGLLHIAVLLPSRVHALVTITDDRWGRRGVAS
jgi:N-acetylglucosaminyltransferase